MKAIKLMEKSKSVKERASVYGERISKSIQKEVLDVSQEKIDRLGDQIYDLENFSLETNHNKGQSEMTIDDCKKRFVEILELDYKRTMETLRLKSLQAKFDELFKVK